MIAAEWGVGQTLWSLFWFFLFIMWIMLVVTVFLDIVRSHDMSGWAKALWSIGIIVFPYLGVFVYLVLRGGSMHERAAAQAKRDEAAFRAYVQDAAGARSPVDELAKLADLRAAGVIDDEEFAQFKARVLAG